MSTMARRSAKHGQTNVEIEILKAIQECKKKSTIDF
jgi:hypothetical protein